LAALIARICAMAAERSANWRIDSISDRKAVSIIFADGSAALVDQHSATVTENGEEAWMFNEDYEALLGPQEVDPETDAGPGF